MALACYSFHLRLRLIKYSTSNGFNVLDAYPVNINLEIRRVTVSQNTAAKELGRKMNRYQMYILKMRKQSSKKSGFFITHVVLILCIALILPVSIPTAFSAVTQNSSCKKIGDYVKVKKSYFECKSLGNSNKWKLVELSEWRRSLLLSLSLSDIPENLVDTVENAAGWSSIPFLRQMRWSADEGSFPNADGVPLSNGTGKKVLIIGDSLAPAMGPALLHIQKVFNWNLRMVFRSSCQIADTTAISGSKDNLEKCKLARQERIRIVNEFQPEILVLIEDTANPIAIQKGESAFQTWQGRFSESLLTLSNQSEAMLVLMSRPTGVKKSLQDCVKGKSRLTPDCFGNASQNANYRIAQKKAIQSVGGSYVDLTPLLCINGSCPPFIENALVYRDHIHFTNSFCEILGKELTEFFGK